MLQHSRDDAVVEHGFSSVVILSISYTGFGGWARILEHRWWPHGEFFGLEVKVNPEH